MNPSANLASQVEAARLHSPEALVPDDNVDRTTASVLHNLNAGTTSVLFSTVVWGMNRHRGHEAAATYSHSFLLESNLQAR